jgi:protein ImuB
LDALCGQAEEALTRLDYKPRLAVAPFPETASLLARGEKDFQVLDPKDIPATIGKLPIDVLEPDASVVDKLRSLGISRVSDLLALPPAGLQRRFGPTLTDRLQRALGKCPDPRRPWRRPSRFRASLELPAAVHAAEPLLFVIRRLLKELAEVLTALGKGVDRLEILLRHDGKRTTRLSFGLSRQSRDAEHWLMLLRTRFEGMSFEQPVQAVELRAPRFLDLQAISGELFENEVPREERHLMDRLRARLGDTAVRGVDLVEDHRPERAWRMVPPEIAMDDEPSYGGGTGKSSGGVSGSKYTAANETVYGSGNKLSSKLGEGQSRCTAGGVTDPHRPLWLLFSPVPLAKEAHKGWRLRNPERIESGWWDGNDVARDYYLAETPRGERLWVFRDLRSRGWYLHGVFS